MLTTGVNQCSFDYKLPRGLDRDVWRLATQPGKLYTTRSYPIDDMSESLAALPVSFVYAPFAYQLTSLGFSAEPTWTRGDGSDVLLHFSGLSRADGSPTRYAIEVAEFADPGDPEGDDAAHAVPIALDTWQAGTIVPSRPPSSTFSTVDTDAFSFAFEDRGIYRIEIEHTPGAPTTPGLDVVGIAERTTPDAASAVAETNGGLSKTVEFRGSGRAWFTVSGYANSSPTIPYRVRAARIGTAQPDDHGNTAAQATMLAVGARPIRVNLAATVSVLGSTARIADQDWFAVPTIAGHAYEVLVQRAGVAINTSSIADVLAEDGGRRADAALYSAQAAPNTNLLASIRFRGHTGEPVRFGLVGNGTATVSVLDIGAVADDLGDPLTGPAVLSMENPTASGALNNPRDIDSFNIQPPATPGVYRVQYTLQYPATELAFAPGVACTTGVSRSSSFHATTGGVNLTRRTDGQTDSFPARVDFLSKPWPTNAYPATGPAIPYTLTLVYVGPLPVTTPPETGPDEAPSTAIGAQTLQPGENRNYVRQGTTDDADTVLLNLQAGHLYRTYSGYYPGEITTPSGRLVTTDPYPLASPGRQFVATESGLYTQRQDFARAYAAGSSSGESYYFQPGVLDLGPVQDDLPNDARPVRLNEGVTHGIADFAGDSDRFFLPYETGAYYRVTLTSTARLWLDIQETSYAPPSVQTPIVQFVYFQPSPLVQQGQPLIVTSLSGGGVPYQINVERLLTIHPASDLPESPGIREPLQPGQTAVVVNDRPLDADVAEFAVRAGRLYDLRVTRPEAPDTEIELRMPLLDQQGRSVASGWMTGPIRATVDEVWHMEFATGFSASPILITLVDLGDLPDDYGTGDRNRSLVAIGETRTGVLETADDADRWHVDAEPAAPSEPTRAARVTVTDLASGARWTQDVSISLYAEDALVVASMFQPPAGTSLAYPLHYTVSAELRQPIAPYIPCKPDLGIAGGRTATNQGDRVLDNNDLIAFINLYFANSARADLGSAGGLSQPDGWLDNNDFIAFIDLFFAGCP